MGNNHGKNWTMREGTLISQWCNESGILRWSKKIVFKTLDHHRPSRPPFASSCTQWKTRLDQKRIASTSRELVHLPEWSKVISQWKWSRDITWASYAFFNSIYPNLSSSESHPNLYFCWKALYGVVTVDWACGCFSSCQPGTSTSCTPLKRMQTQQRPFCHQIRCIFLDKW